MSPRYFRRLAFSRSFLFCLLPALLLGGIASAAAFRGTTARALLQPVPVANVLHKTSADFLSKSPAAAQSTSSIYSNTVRGAQNLPGPGVNPLSVELEVAGSLPGSLIATLDHNNSHEIVVGSWELKVARPDDASELGTLKGTFTGGSVAINDDGTVAAINAARMIIESGTGNYAAVASGTGTLEGIFNHSSSPPFSGTFDLTF